MDLLGQTLTEEAAPHVESDVIEAARDLVAMWRAQNISSATRAERNAAIEEMRTRLHLAVDKYERAVVRNSL